MRDLKHGLDPKKPTSGPLKQRARDAIKRILKLKGEPHYVAMGMAVGVFAGATPTIPFHTVIAFVLAFVLRASKAAAVIGCWVGNPITIPFFYLGSYRVGTFLWGTKIPYNEDNEALSNLLDQGLDAILTMITGSLFLAFPLAIAAYFITLKVFRTIRLRKSNPNHPIRKPQR
jgi:hypothetical protein